MTSRPPYWCAKTNETAAMLVSQLPVQTSSGEVRRCPHDLHAWNPLTPKQFDSFV